MDLDWQTQLGKCEELIALMGSNSVDLVFTDPPYNVGKDYGVYKDNLSLPDYRALMAHVIEHCKRVSNNNIAFYVSGSLRKLYSELIPDAHMIIIHKRAHGVKKGNFYLQYHCLFVTGEPLFPIRDIWDDIRLPGEGYYYREPRYGNPGETSLALTKRVVDTFCERGGTVLDPYIGCGTTAIACLQIGRKPIGWDVNPDYLRVTHARIKEELLERKLAV